MSDRKNKITATAACRNGGVTYVTLSDGPTAPPYCAEFRGEITGLLTEVLNNLTWRPTTDEASTLWIGARNCKFVAVAEFQWVGTTPRLVVCPARMASEAVWDAAYALLAPARARLERGEEIAQSCAADLAPRGVPRAAPARGRSTDALGKVLCTLPREKTTLHAVTSALEARCGLGEDQAMTVLWALHYLGLCVVEKGGVRLTEAGVRARKHASWRRARFGSPRPG